MKLTCFINILRVLNYDQSSGNYWNKFISAISNFFQRFFYYKKKKGLILFLSATVVLQK